MIPEEGGLSTGGCHGAAPKVLLAHVGQGAPSDQQRPQPCGVPKDLVV